MMKLLRCVLLFVLLCLGATKVDAAHKQIWHKDILTVNMLGDCIGVGAAYAWRWDLKEKHLFQHFLELSCHLRPSYNLELIGTYRHNFLRFFDEEGKGYWKDKPEPIFDVIKKWQKSGLHFSDRSRFQLSFLTHTWLYRNRGMIEFPIPLGLFTITPYTSEEMFFNRGTDFNQNRWQVGIFFPIWSCIKVEAAYRLLHFRQPREETSWHQVQVYLLRIYGDF